MCFKINFRHSEHCSEQTEKDTAPPRPPLESSFQGERDELSFSDEQKKVDAELSLPRTSITFTTPNTMGCETKK